MVITPVDAPARVAYDAPAWLPANRPVKFGELVDAADLQGTGYVPGTMRVPFRTAPDLFTWRDGPFPLELRYRAPPGPIEDLAVSRLDVSINDFYLTSLPLASEPARGTTWLSRWLRFGGAEPWTRVDVPPYQVFGQNDLQFFFDTRPLHRGDCVAIPQDLRDGGRSGPARWISAAPIASRSCRTWRISSAPAFRSRGWRICRIRPWCCRRSRPPGS